MDKNMIHIDDLVRQRLNGGEEEEKPGAWLNMRELLDEQMPVNKVPGGVTNWRRLLGYTAALLLLATITAGGGYEMVTGMKGHGNGAISDASQPVTKTGGAHHTITSSAVLPVTTNAIKEPATTTNEGVAIKTTASSATIVKHNLHATNNVTAIKHNLHTAKTAKTAIAPGKPVADNNADNGNIAAQTNNITNAAATDNTVATSNDTDNNISQTRNHQTQKHQKTSLQKHSVATGTIAAVNKPVLNSSVVVTAKKHIVTSPATTIAKTHTSNTTNTTTAVAHKKAQHTQTTATQRIIPASTIAAITSNKSTTSKQPVISQEKVQEEKVARIEVVQRMAINPVRQISTTYYDTVSIGKIALDKPATAALASNTAVADKKTSISPKEEKDSKGKLVAHSSDGRTTMEKFNQMIENFKYNFGHMEFTPGIIAGVNATFFGPYSLKGFQLGVTGNWKMNDRWSFITELKYINRTSNNATIHDNYIRYNPNSFVKERDSVQRYFNLSNLQSIELPIAVNYKVGKFNIFLGGSLLYNFAINASFVENPYALPEANGPVSAPKLSVNDFAARLGLTYMAGVAYQVSPAVQIDLRLSQMFWDNAKGSGAQIISDDLYHMPSVQLSIGYTVLNRIKKLLNDFW